MVADGPRINELTNYRINKRGKTAPVVFNIAPESTVTGKKNYELRTTNHELTTPNYMRDTLIITPYCMHL